MRLTTILFVPAALAVLSFSRAGTPTSKPLTQTSAGPIKLGMTVAEAQKAMPDAKFERQSDGDGVALIGVLVLDDNPLVLYAGELDPDKPINFEAKIELIQVYGGEYQTASGIFPGMTIAEAEKKLGKLKQIMLSEIESREYAEFAGQPSGLAFRVQGKNDSAGAYSEGEFLSQKYNTDAEILSIEVRGPSIMQDASIGGLKIGTPVKDVEAIAAKSGFGTMVKGEVTEQAATGEFIQIWEYADAGIIVATGAFAVDEPKTVSSITLTEKSKLRTAKGIGIGSSKADVLKAYADYQQDESAAGMGEGVETIVFGSVYGGLFFTFESGKVTSIFLGAGAE